MMSAWYSLYQYIVQRFSVSCIPSIFASLWFYHKQCHPLLRQSICLLVLSVCLQIVNMDLLIPTHSGLLVLILVLRVFQSWPVGASPSCLLCLCHILSLFCKHFPTFSRNRCSKLILDLPCPGPGIRCSSGNPDSFSADGLWSQDLGAGVAAHTGAPPSILEFLHKAWGNVDRCLGTSGCLAKTRPEASLLKQVIP